MDIGYTDRRDGPLRRPGFIQLNLQADWDHERDRYFVELWMGRKIECIDFVDGDKLKPKSVDKETEEWARAVKKDDNPKLRNRLATKAQTVRRKQVHIK